MSYSSGETIRGRPLTAWFFVKENRFFSVIYNLFAKILPRPQDLSGFVVKIR
jgi:hypothetical protein